MIGRRPTPAALPRPAGHGGDGVAVARALGLAPEELLDLSLSVNPFAPEWEPALAAHLGALRRYPDVRPARDALARCMGVDPDRLVLTNGGAEAIALVAAELGHAWVEEPEFSLWRRHLREVRPGAPRVRSNPHSPSGRLAARSELAAVWDEAFYPLSTGDWTRGDPGAAVVGSLTKLLGCPGLRIGYALLPEPARARRLARCQPEWSVNALAVAALPEMLAQVHLRRWAAQLVAAREALGRVLVDGGLSVITTDAPWLLLAGARGLREPLARNGVLVRDCASFGLDDICRIAVPAPEALARVAEAVTGLAAVGWRSPARAEGPSAGGSS